MWPQLASLPGLQRIERQELTGELMASVLPPVRYWLALQPCTRAAALHPFVACSPIWAEM